MRTRRITAAVLALGLAAGCVGSNGRDEATADSNADTPAASEEPTTTNVRVNLRDTPPLNVLFNSDDKVCTTVNMMDALDLIEANPDATTDELRDMLPKVEVTLRDSDGKVIGAMDLPPSGGTFDGGCEWPIEFADVPISDFYEVRVRAPDGTQDAVTAEGGEDAVIRVDL